MLKACDGLFRAYNNNHATDTYLRDGRGSTGELKFYYSAGSS